ncbi:MAG: ABC transporter substrate-binding protein, partial [candidate division KSB1 bacterium]|nr:ABC transporter substrate-binding protein [candidate division KSB1 bacterium]
MKHSRWLLAGVVLAVFAVTLGVGCAKKGQRGVTDTEIVIGQWGPQTGPAALWGAVARGTAAYFKMINEEEGGIHGRKIRYIYRDDAYQPAKTKAVVKEMVENEGVFAFVGGVGTAPGMAVKDYLVQNKVPWVGPASGSSHWAYPPNEYIFAVYPLYFDEATIMVDYAVNTLKKTRIAMIYQNDDYGKGGLVGAKMALEKHGLDFVATATTQIMDTDLSSHILKLKEAGAEVVIMYLLPKQAAISLGTAAKLGFKPQWMTTSTLSDMSLMHNITKGLWEGVIFANFAEMPDSDHPLMKKYREAAKKYAPDERWGVFFAAGFLFAEPMVEGLKRAGKDLTVESFIEAMESIKDFKGIGPTITFGPNQRQGTRSVFLSQCVSATEAKQLTDWMTS